VGSCLQFFAAGTKQRQLARVVVAAAIKTAPATTAQDVVALAQTGSAQHFDRGFAAAPAGFDLQLSGHTHGGQFFPWNLVVRLFHPFTAGLHRVERLWVYVSRGTGYWGPPKRLGAPSEITYLRLVPAGRAHGDRVTWR
jgi:hypothetical protein